MKKICITGHRVLLRPGEVREHIRYSLLYFKTQHHTLEAYTSLAAGSDTIFAEEALKLDIPVKIMLPFAAEIFRQDFSVGEWEQAEAVMANPLSTLFIAQELKAINDDTKKEAYLATGKKLVDETNIVFAVWDGLPSLGKGGTAEIVSYAQEKGKEIHILKALRQTRKGEAAIEDKLLSKFNTYDTTAIILKQQWFEPAWIAGIITGVLAAFSFSAGIALKLIEAPGSHRWHDTKFLLAAAEIIFLVVSLFLLLKFARRWKNDFLDNRRKGEYLRAVLWFRNAGIPFQPGIAKGYSPGKEILAMEKEVAASIRGIKNRPNAIRMIWCLARMQSDYHLLKRITPFKRRIHRVENWLIAIRLLFFAIVLINFGLEYYEYIQGHLSPVLHSLQPWFIFGWMALPPVYAALEGIKYFTEWKTHIAKSEKILNELERIADIIQQCDDDTSLASEANNLRTIMELENNDWSQWWQARQPGAGI